MKNVFMALALATSLAACSKSDQKQETSESVPETAAPPISQVAYTRVAEGDSITADGALTLEEAKAQLDKSGKLAKVKVTGTVVSVCQKKGCWMKVQMPGGELMHVTFKDYSFFVPKDTAAIVGRQVVIEGEMFTDTTSVEDLRHYAFDAGKSDAEQAKITQPKVETIFDATGVLIAKK